MREKPTAGTLRPGNILLDTLWLNKGFQKHTYTYLSFPSLRRFMRCSCVFPACDLVWYTGDRCVTPANSGGQRSPNRFLNLHQSGERKAREHGKSFGSDSVFPVPLLFEVSEIRARGETQALEVILVAHSYSTGGSASGSN